METALALILKLETSQNIFKDKTVANNEFSNPVPVAVALVEFEGKLIGIRRGIHPKIGEVAFPGGYINSGETFKEALSRELLEETGVQTSKEDWEVFFVGDSIQSNRILIFGKYLKAIDHVDFNFKSNETQEVLLIDGQIKLAFPLHEDARDAYLEVK
jgi:ADP-ribose pyrophosphatase YjhB (NUDIX family)